MTVELKPNVTIDQFSPFYRTKLIPAYEKEFQGAKGFIATGVRGEHANHIALFWLFDTESGRNRYFNPDGTPNELGKATLEKLRAIDKELEKFRNFYLYLY